MGGNLIRFITFITLHIRKSGEIGGFSFFLIPGWKNKNGRRDFPNFLKKKNHKIIYLKFNEYKKKIETPPIMIFCISGF